VLNSALMQIHREIEEAGYVSGLSIRSVLLRIFVPILLPAILGIWLWTALVTYRELTVAAVLFNPKNVTLPIVVWNLWTAGGMGAAAAVTLVMLAVFMPLVLLYWYATGRRGVAF
jgi:iron(III) transport system permease protein